MFEQFLSELSLPGCIIQFGKINKVLEIFSQPTEEDLTFDGDAFFVGGVVPARGMERARDEDIRKKNYIYFDIDIRKANPDASDEEIKFSVDMYYKPRLAQTKFKNWRYIIFTGNGLHVYYFSETPVEIKDPNSWKIGQRLLVDEMQEIFDEDIVDTACVNVSRIARLPGSLNMKKSPPKKVEIISFQDQRTDMLEAIEASGEADVRRLITEHKGQTENLSSRFPSADDPYKRINNLPIEDVVCKVMGWTSDGKHFYAPGSKWKSACFIPPGANFLVHGGTSHIPASKKGFSPFELVKAVKEYNSGETFGWFKRHFPSAFPEEQRANAPATNISDIMKKLQALHFEPLRINEELDPYKIVIRGAVTRIGAMSFTGKSTMGYFLLHRLIKSGYRGIVFSTEVPAEIVLANLIKIEKKLKSIWDVLHHMPDVTLGMEELFNNLSIHDVMTTQNSMLQIEDIIKKQISLGLQPDFIMVDYCQMIWPRKGGGDDFRNARQYAFESQSLAQTYKTAWICLSQLNKAGIKDEDEKYGVIPFENSASLYAAADIAIMMKRDKSKFDSGDRMTFDIRKHKFLSKIPPVLYMKYEREGCTYSLTDTPIEKEEYVN